MRDTCVREKSEKKICEREKCVSERCEKHVCEREIWERNVCQRETREKFLKGISLIEMREMSLIEISLIEMCAREKYMREMCEGKICVALLHRPCFPSVSPRWQGGAIRRGESDQKKWQSCDSLFIHKHFISPSSQQTPPYQPPFSASPPLLVVGWNVGVFGIRWNVRWKLVVWDFILSWHLMVYLFMSFTWLIHMCNMTHSHM